MPYKTVPAAATLLAAFLLGVAPACLNADPAFSDDHWIRMNVIPGANDEVYSSAVDASGNLYIGGWFTAVGGAAAHSVAKWDGSSWSALGSGLTDPYDIYTIGWVSGLAVAGSDLYATGNFTTAGGVAATNIAKWDGSSWSALGSGLGNGTAGGYALSTSETGSDLYVAGDFMLAGGKPSPSVARAILHLPSLTLNETTSSTVAISWPSPSMDFVLEQNADGLDLNWSNVTDSIVDDGTNKVVTQPIGTNRFFRPRPALARRELRIRLTHEVLRPQARQVLGTIGFDYTGYTLQSAPTSTGAFTSLPGATNPYTQPVTGAQEYFRSVFI